MSLFHRPAAFWSGCLLICAGVLSHGPMFLMGQHTQWQMVGMPMTLEMWVGMALIPLGLGLSWLGLRPPPLGAAGAPPLAAGHFHVAEAVPARHRGWLLVALGGVGTSAGYLLAAGAAAWLEPLFSWRVLWLLGLPTGAVILLLNRFIPESPRFLWASGRHQQALKVLQRFAGTRDGVERDDAAHPAPPVIDERHPVAGVRQLLRGHHAPLARSAVYALPGIAVVVWLYHRWSSYLSLVSFIALTVLALLGFFDHLVASALVLAVPMALSALMLSRSGIETRGVRLEEIQASLRG
jgi:putative MFS transporter